MSQLQDDLPALGDLVGVGRAQGDQPGDRAQREQLLDRLVRWSVLADADRVVREEVDDREFHDRGQPDRRAAVVAEDQETRSVRAQLRERQPVQDRTHRVLANAEMKIASRVAGRFEVSGAFERHARLRRGGQIRGAADDPRHGRRHCVQDLRRRVTTGDPFGISGEARNRLLPAIRQVALLHLQQAVGVPGVFRLVYASKSVSHCSRCLAPRSPMFAAKCSRTPSGTRNLASSGQP